MQQFLFLPCFQIYSLFNFTLFRKYFIRMFSHFSGAILLLTLYLTIQYINGLEGDTFQKYCGKRKKSWLHAFSPSPMIFLFFQYKFYSTAKFYFLSAITTTWHKTKILSSYKKRHLILLCPKFIIFQEYQKKLRVGNLTLYQMTKFWTCPCWKHMPTTK